MDFFERLKAELEYLGFSQKELSARTGISINTIRGWFSKKVFPDLESAYKISQVLNVSLEYLLTGKSTSKNDPEIPHDDKALLETYHSLSDHDKKVLKTIISTMTKISDEISPDNTNYIIVK